jgi:hypothetical protein
LVKKSDYIPIKCVCVSFKTNIKKTRRLIEKRREEERRKCSTHLCAERQHCAVVKLQPPVAAPFLYEGVIVPPVDCSDMRNDS